MIRIHNAKTNEIIDREMSDEEIATYEADQKAEKLLQEAIAKAAAKKAAAEAKLSALGLTADDLKALGL